MASTALTLTSDLGLTIAARAAERTGNIKTLSEGRSDTFKVNPLLIEIEDGFNVRDFESPEVAEHIDQLAQSIAKIGVQRPLKVRNKSAKGAKLVLVDGECRLRATIRAIDVYGAEIYTIPVILADRSMSDADAALGILVENGGLDVTVLGKSEIVKRLSGFGWSKDDIAAKAGMSKARVTQLLELSGLDTSVKALINAGTVSATTALAVVKDNDYDTAATVKAITAAQETVAAKGRTRVTARSIPTTKVSVKDEVAKLINTADVEMIDNNDTVILTLAGEDWAKIKELLKLV